MFYATVKYYQEDSSVYVNDLHRFTTKKERDQYVENDSDTAVVTRKEAQIEYKEQFKYWNKNI